MLKPATLQQHLIYAKSPELFMKERWITFNCFNVFKCDYIQPFEYQLNFIKNIHNSQNNLVVKSRQMHVSSMMALYIAWYVLFNQNKTIAIISHSSESGKNILDQIKIILQAYSLDYEKEGIISTTFYHWEDDFVKNNKTELSLKNGCRIKVFAPTASAGRGESLDFLYIDEAAHIKDLEQIWMAAGMALTYKTGKSVLASSPNNNSWFNYMYLNADKTDYINTIKLHWSIHPKFSKDIVETRGADSIYEYSSPWYEEIKRSYNESQIEQQLECILNYKEETNKTKTVSLRIDNNLHKKIQDRLNPGESTSDYIRKLIEKDLN